MNKLIVTCLVFGSIFLISCLAIGSFYNTALSFNKTIEAQVINMQAKYNEYFTKVKEAAQVPTAQMAKLKEFYDEIVKSRSSEGAMFKFIAENNPNINQDTYVEIQRIIEASRSEIYDTQRVHIDTVREYNTYIATFPNNIINNLFHYTQKIATVLISDNVKDLFKENKDKVMEIF